MKQHAQVNVVERSEGMVAQEFKIKATAKAFNILSSGLYSNKILAIVRELSCNAYDSHVAAGKKDTPIEIHLPTVLDPIFYVKDFGIGLDHAGVTELYTTYFESTKQDSNDFIGALGLGSKSPFSYTQSFTVAARYDGVKRTYTAYIGENGVPQITKMAEAPTDECNGLCVSLAVKRDDIMKFEEAAQKALMYFTPMPTMNKKNFAPFKLTHTIHGSNWSIRETDYFAHMDNAFVVQGFVAYPVDVQQLKEHGLSGLAYNIARTNIDVRVAIGAVEVAASREALQYDKRTCANLVCEFEKIGQEMRATTQKEFDTCTTVWDARQKYLTLKNDEKFREIFTNMNSSQAFTFNGVKLVEAITLNVTDVKNTEIIIVYKQCYGNKLRRSTSWGPKADSLLTQKGLSFEFSARRSECVLLDDLTHGTNDIVKQHLSNSKSSNDQYAIILRPSSKQVLSASKREMIELIKQLGDPEVQLVSALGITVPLKKGYSAKKSDVRWTWTGFPMTSGRRGRSETHRVFSKKCWMTTKCDITKGGIYIPVEKFTIMNNGRDMYQYDVIIEQALALQLLTPLEVSSLVAFNVKEIAHAKKAAPAKWSDVFSVIESRFKKANVNDAMLNPIVSLLLKEKFGDRLCSSVFGQWDKIKTTVADCSFKTTVNQIVEAMKVGQHDKAASVRRMLDNLNTQEKVATCETKAQDLKTLWLDTNAEYAMLGLINWDYSHDSLPTIVDYINTVVKARSKK